MFVTVLVFIAVLSLLVFAHEFGHFLMARRAGMKVEEFGFGFPPRLFGMRRGATLYSINAIPLGGFVKIKGESGDYAEEGDSFAHKSVFVRFSVLVAGVAMNVILAFVLLSVGFATGLPSVVDDTLPASARVHGEATRIVEVLPESPADRAGIKVADELVMIDNQLFSTTEMAYSYLARAEEPVELLLRRGETHVRLTLTKEEIAGVEGSVIGVVLMRSGIVSYPVPSAVAHGAVATGQLTRSIVVGFWDLLRSLVNAKPVPFEVSGPVGIAVMTGEVARLGIPYLIQFTALLSLNLAVLNILPIPALDGGRIFFLLIEAVRARRVSAHVETVVHNLGFLLLLLLVVLVTYRDLVRLGRELFGAFTSA
ncbi:RIP metalloprotease RseP [Candidatus Uhrbacteria bacterium]|nr:RIP metalloprotease RseP [Candidatus Uhrbacteria bacterium]